MLSVARACRASLAMAVPAAAEVHDSATDAQQQPEAERPPTDQQPEQAPPGDEQRLEKVIRRSLEGNAVAQQLTATEGSLPPPLPPAAAASPATHPALPLPLAPPQSRCGWTSRPAQPPS